MPDRLTTYAASLLIEWLAGRSGRAYALERAENGGPPVFIARSDEGTLALAIAPLWDPATDAAAEEARVAMQERLTAGNVHGPYLLWVPPRASVPADEPDASGFVQRVQVAAASMRPGARGEVELPAAIQLAKIRDEGGYASVIGGLSRWWTLITERVNGTFHVNSARIRRAPQSAGMREAIIDKIGELSRSLQTGEAIEFDTTEAWTVQRLREEPLGETGFAIALAPPTLDPTDGTLLRRLIRTRLRDANAALDAIDADMKAVGLIAIYEYAEHENIGAFIRSLDPSLFARLDTLLVLVDGEVRPVVQPR